MWDECKAAARRRSTAIATLVPLEVRTPISFLGPLVLDRDCPATVAAVSRDGDAAGFEPVRFEVAPMVPHHAPAKGLGIHQAKRGRGERMCESESAGHLPIDLNL